MCKRQVDFGCVDLLGRKLGLSCIRSHSAGYEEIGEIYFGVLLRVNMGTGVLGHQFN